MKTRKESEVVFQVICALRVIKKKDGKSPVERFCRRPSKTVNSGILKILKEIFQRKDRLKNEVELNLEDFLRDADSEFWVKEKQLQEKLSNFFKKRRGRVMAETSHIIQFASRTKAKSE